MPALATVRVQKAVAPWAMNGRAHLGENHGRRLAQLDTAIDTLSPALIAAGRVLLPGCLTVACARNCGAKVSADSGRCS